MSIMIREQIDVLGKTDSIKWLNLSGNKDVNVSLTSQSRNLCLFLNYGGLKAFWNMRNVGFEHYFVIIFSF